MTLEYEVRAYEFVIALRLLERKVRAVLSPVRLVRPPDTEAPYAEIRGGARVVIPARLEPWVSSDWYEGMFVHELVHIAQLERGDDMGSGAFYRDRMSPHWRAYVAAVEANDDDAARDSAKRYDLLHSEYYRRFSYERAAKLIEMRLVFGPEEREDSEDLLQVVTWPKFYSWRAEPLLAEDCRVVGDA